MLPPAKVDAAYTATVTARPPNAPTTKSIVCACTPGRGLPPGLTATDHGTSMVISGVPTTAQNYSFELQDVWADSSGALYFGQRTFEIDVTPGSGTPKTTEKTKTPPRPVAAA